MVNKLYQQLGDEKKINKIKVGKIRELENQIVLIIDANKENFNYTNILDEKEKEIK
jgi:hypothetical protein